MTDALVPVLDALLTADDAAVLDGLRAHGDKLVAAAREGELAYRAEAAAERLVRVVASGAGSAEERVVLGDLLGWLGDPRLSRPGDDAYWAALTGSGGDSFAMGRFPVTNAEYRAWVDDGGYADDAAWSEAGRAWRDATDDPWPVLIERADAAAYACPNQPVVGVTWYEAEAFAAAHGARLPAWWERVWAVRGAAKRNYPWGKEYEEGFANTKEEVLRRTVAVGLFKGDVTPEGLHDLAGNAGEWTGQRAGAEYLLHPGAFDQPSLAAWAKALTTEKPEARASGLGFRLAKDA